MARFNKYYDKDAFKASAASCSRNDLSILHLNAQSLKSKEERVCMLLDDFKYNFDILAFSETWFTDEYEVQFPGYRCTTVSRKEKRGGGVAFYIKNDLHFETVTEFSVVNPHYESLMMKCYHTAIVVIYRPPSGAIDAFFNFLERMLNFCSELGLTIVTTGDFNINMLSLERNKQVLLDLFLSYGLENVIDVPTRVTDVSETLIDLCFIPQTNVIEAGVLISDVSDHMPIFVFFNPHSKTHRMRANKAFKLRKINKSNVAAFQTAVSETSWSYLYQLTDPVIAYNYFINHLKKLYDEAFPVTTIKQNKKCRKPWITTVLLRRMKERDRLFSQFIKTRQPNLLTVYKKIRNKLGRDIKEARNCYYERKFETILNDPKRVWQTLKGLLPQKEPLSVSEIVDSDITYTGISLANKFNEHFLKCGASVSDNCDRHNYRSYIMHNSLKSLFMEPTTEHEIKSQILKLKNASACGQDEIKAEPIKAVVNSISNPLSHICNLILATGVFPDKLKIARVTVIFKGGDRNDMNNYRPISVLPLFSKIFEQMINVRIMNFCTKNDVLTGNQYGFQKKKSSEMALLSIKEKIIQNFEDKKYTLGIFLDFKKAFDSIKHDILLKKLSEYGVRGLALDLIRSYLTNRYQYTDTNHSKSVLGEIKYGVPQGSILGPLLFLLYINDIGNIPFTPDIILYADDTNVFFSGENLHILQLQASKWLNNLSEWLIVNKLELNTKKTKYIIFRCRNKSIRNDVHLKFRGEIIERVRIHKFLGVLFEENLSWSPHIDNLTRRISRSIGIISRAKQLLPRWLKLQLYYALIHSHLQYCLLVWGTTTKTNLKKLYILQKRIVRVIENVPYITHSAPLFKANTILTMQHILKKKLGITIFQKIKLCHDSFFRQFLGKGHAYETRKTRYDKGFTRTNYGMQKQSYVIADFLNHHPTVLNLVQETMHMKCFKRKLTAYLLSIQE